MKTNFWKRERIPLRTLVEAVLSGEIRDGKTQTALLKVWCLQNGKRVEKENGSKTVLVHRQRSAYIFEQKTAEGRFLFS